MTARLGIAYYPKDAPNVIDLIRNADAALYHAKKSGGNVFSFYAPKRNEASVERLMTKSKLKRAFERDELLVHYQPKYNLETGEVFSESAFDNPQIEIGPDILERIHFAGDEAGLYKTNRLNVDGFNDHI